MRANAPVRACVAAAVAAAAIAAPAAAAPSAITSTVPAQAAPAARAPAAAVLEQCAASGAQVERSATFSGEMRLVPGASRMQMRIEVLMRGPADAAFRPVGYPGLGAWRSASAGVKIYKNLSRVTDLAGPASYRADVSFRWLNARGRTIRTQDILTARCRQPATPAGAAGAGAA